MSSKVVNLKIDWEWNGGEHNSKILDFEVSITKHDQNPDDGSLLSALSGTAICSYTFHNVIVDVGEHYKASVRAIFLNNKSDWVPAAFVQFDATGDEFATDESVQTVQTDLTQKVVNQLALANTWSPSSPPSFPTSTDIDSAYIRYVESSIAGFGFLRIKLTDAEGGVHVALNNVDLGTCSGADNAIAWYDFIVDNIVIGLNEIAIWSTNGDAGTINQIDLYTGGDVTSQNTSADTANVNGVGADIVQAYADAGNAANTKIETEIGDGILESTSGSQSKADIAKSESISELSKTNWKYTGEWEIDSPNVGYDFEFSSVPDEYKSFMRIAIEHIGLKSNTGVFLNSIYFDSVDASTDLRSWKVMDIPDNIINTTTDNILTIENDGTQEDGVIYSVQMFFDQKAASLAGVSWGDVDGRPTSLSELNTSDGTKLNSVESGATNNSSQFGDDDKLLVEYADNALRNDMLEYSHITNAVGVSVPVPSGVTVSINYH